jgi:hypothetical protein
MFRGAIEMGKSPPLQLGRSKFWSTDGAAVNHTVLRLANLKRIGVHKGDESRIRNENIGCINIADDIAALMQSAYRGS